MPKTTLPRPKALLRSESGAFDLPSIVVGVVVVGILTVGVLVAVFGVIPWAQDEAAKQDLVSVRTAEGVAKTKGDDGFLDSADLAAATYLPLSEGVKVAANDKGTCYTGVAKSGSGKLFYSTNKTNQPLELTPTTMTHPVPGCLPADEASDLVDDAGGYDDSYFDEVGDGAGTNEDPGIGETEPAPDIGGTTAGKEPSANSDGGDADGSGGTDSTVPSMPAEDPNTEVRVVDLRVNDGSVTVDFENAGDTKYRIPYSIHVACRDDYDGAVTIERIDGYFDLNSNIISGLSLVACIPGTTIVDVWIPTYDWDGQVYRWRINYVYEYAEPVVRGATASATGLWCIENHDNANTIGNPVDLAECANVDAQRWQWNGDGEVRQSTLAGKCLAVSSGKLVLDECDGSAAQHFTAEDFQGKDYEIGLVQMVNKANGQCIDIPGGTLHHVQLVTNECDGTLPQSWYMPGMGQEAAEVVAPETSAEPFPKTGFVREPVVDSGGRQVHFKYGVDSGQPGEISFHYTLTCRDTDGSTRTINSVRTRIGFIPGTTNNDYLDCGTDSVIGYTIDPMTTANIKEVNLPISPTDYTIRDSYSWTPETEGYADAGFVKSPVVESSGRQVHFKFGIDGGRANDEVSFHYTLTCRDNDGSIRKINSVRSHTGVIPGTTNNDILDCGTDSVIGYTIEPLQFIHLDVATLTLPVSPTGYTVDGSFSWDAATDGYADTGFVTSPVIDSSGREVTFKIGVDSGRINDEVSFHYTLTCRDNNGSIRSINSVRSHYSVIPGTRSNDTLDCGSDNVIGYSIEPLEFKHLDVDTLTLPVNPTGYTLSGSYSWDAAEDGYAATGFVKEPTLDYSGRQVQYRYGVDAGEPSDELSFHYMLTCQDSDGSTRKINSVRSHYSSFPGTVSSHVLDCGSDKVIAYTIEPLQFSHLNVANLTYPVNPTGYTIRDSYTWAL